MKSLTKTLSILVLSLGLLSIGCEKAAQETGSKKKTVESTSVKSIDKKTDNKTNKKQADSKVTGVVAVAKTGTKFTPSIKPETLPEGSWACVMGGKVHYARLEKGDGKCEICKMNLSEQKKEGVKEEHGEHKHDDDGHGHGGDHH